MTNPPRRVVIVGASFAGMFAAAAMARAGTEVTLLERDRLTDRGEPRPGVPQSVQPHILLYRGLLTAENLLPGLERNVLDAGGLRIDTGKIAWLGSHGWSPTHLPSYDILSVSRPVLEFLVRRRVLEIPGVSLRDGFRVSGLGQTADGWEVSGSTGETVLGDMVVDASGRGSRLPHWLTELGYSVPEPESVEAKLGYASRRYQGPEPQPLESGLVIVATPESPVGSTILPIEDRQWLVLATGSGYQPTVVHRHVRGPAPADEQRPADGGAAAAHPLDRPDELALRRWRPGLRSGTHAGLPPGGRTQPPFLPARSDRRPALVRLRHTARAAQACRARTDRRTRLSRPGLS
jgi:2-polyprenyl-6-methoxyphenol hydroxylase-like FAD-dependent oxidoreductase